MDLSQRALHAAGGEQTVFAEVNLQASARAATGVRTPLAIAVVLDTSGSMSGAKIADARAAILQLVERMADTDLISLVTYDTSPMLRWGLTPVGTTRSWANDSLSRIDANGGTSIPQGIQMGYNQLGSAPRHFARRVVLVSDGVDGSGISLQEMSERLQALSSEGTAISALGLGLDYSEAFLSTVAEAGAGNYAFASNGAEVAPFLNARWARSSFPSGQLPSSLQSSRPARRRPIDFAGRSRCSVSPPSVEPRPRCCWHGQPRRARHVDERRRPLGRHRVSRSRRRRRGVGPASHRPSKSPGSATALASGRGPSATTRRHRHGALPDRAEAWDELRLPARSRVESRRTSHTLADRRIASYIDALRAATRAASTSSDLSLEIDDSVLVALWTEQETLAANADALQEVQARH